MRLKSIPVQFGEKSIMTDWIPVIKQPPFREKWLLVTVETATGRYVAKAMLSEHGFWTGVGNSSAYNVIAWMPLPEPYKPD